MSVLGYWKIRGFAQHIRYMLHYAGETFTEQLYVTGDGPEFNKECWFKEKFTLGYDFPNLPFYDDGVVKMTQSMAITRYLARKHNLDGDTVQEKARIDQVVEEVIDLRRGLTTLTYLPLAQFNADKPEFIKRTQDKFEQLERYIGNNTWIAGSNISYADFLLCEVLDKYRVLEPTILDRTPKLKALVGRFLTLPAIKKYRDSETFISGPIYNINATFTGL